MRAYHRLIRLPAGVEAEPEAIRAAFPALLDFAETLTDAGDPAASDLAAALRTCREAL